MIKIYLAGPTVFYEDALKRAEQMKLICEKYGFIGLFPMDNIVQPGTKEQMAKDIYAGNVALMREADIIVADVNPFRGLEPDSGTSFEIGFMAALGKPIFTYISNGSELVEKQTSYMRDDVHFDSEGMIVEDFGLAANIMIGIASKVVVGTFEDCIKEVKNELK